MFGPANQVANSSLTGLEGNWKGKSVIWETIEENEGIVSLETIERLFLAKVPKKVVVELLENEIKKKVGTREFFTGDA